MSTAIPARLLEADIPVYVREVLSGLHANGFKAYLVGGCVRDMLRGQSPKDYDLATSARPEQVQRAFRKVIPTGIEHGTVTVLMKGHPLEVTTFRKEAEYVDGRRPSRVEFQQEIIEDLSRRDFTINAMAFDPDGPELADPFGGQLDLADQVIRCVGSAMSRFSEDGLRALRAVRFSAMLGFTLDHATAAAIPATLQVFRKVATERVKEELQKLLTSDRPALGVGLLSSTGLLAEILPELVAVGPERLATALRVVAAVPSRIELRLAALLHVLPSTAERAKELVRGLKFPNVVIEKVRAVLAHHDSEAEWGGSDAQLRRYLARVKRENVDEVLALEAARFRHQAEWPRFEAFRARIEQLAAQNPPLEARDLALDGGAIMKALAIPPSRAVGEATRHLVDLVLEDPTLNEPARLTEALAKWAKTKGNLVSHSGIHRVVPSDASERGPEK